MYAMHSVIDRRQVLHGLRAQLRGLETLLASDTLTPDARQDLLSQKACLKQVVAWITVDDFAPQVTDIPASVFEEFLYEQHLCEENARNIRLWADGEEVGYPLPSLRFLYKHDTVRILSGERLIEVADDELAWQPLTDTFNRWLRHNPKYWDVVTSSNLQEP